MFWLAISFINLAIISYFYVYLSDVLTLAKLSSGMADANRIVIANRILCCLDSDKQYQINVMDLF